MCVFSLNSINLAIGEKAILSRHTLVPAQRSGALVLSQHKGTHRLVEGGPQYVAAIVASGRGVEGRCATKTSFISWR